VLHLPLLAVIALNPWWWSVRLIRSRLVLATYDLERIHF